MTSLRYRICGLSAVSEIALPLDPVELGADEANITIRRGAVPEALNCADYVGPTWQVGKQGFLVSVPGVARLLVQSGTSIIADLAPAASDDDVAPFILSTAFAGIIHQRQILPLHASTIAQAGQAIALCGPSGTGKSTLAATLCKGGWDFVGDDVAPIRLLAGQSPLIAPDGRRHRLWADAIAHLDLGGQQERPVRDHLDKFHVRARADGCNGERELPLGAIVLLTIRPRHAAPAPPRIERLQPVDAAPLLCEQVYRIGLARHMGHEGRIFMQTAAVLAQVPLFQLERTIGMEYLDEAARLVREVLE